MGSREDENSPNMICRVPHPEDSQECPLSNQTHSEYVRRGRGLIEVRRNPINIHSERPTVDGDEGSFHLGNAIINYANAQVYLSVKPTGKDCSLKLYPHGGTKGFVSKFVLLASRC